VPERRHVETHRRDFPRETEGLARNHVKVWESHLQVGRLGKPPAEVIRKPHYSIFPACILHNESRSISGSASRSARHPRETRGSCAQRSAIAPHKDPVRRPPTRALQKGARFISVRQEG